MSLILLNWINIRPSDCSKTEIPVVRKPAKSIVKNNENSKYDVNKPKAARRNFSRGGGRQKTIHLL